MMRANYEENEVFSAIDECVKREFADVDQARSVAVFLALTLFNKPLVGIGSHYSISKTEIDEAFTERGLYMLATVLNSNRAVRATKAIIETYAQVRSMVRDMEAIQTEKAGSPEQTNLLTRAGHKRADLIGDNLTTQSRKTTIELNLALLKITHEVKQGKE